MNILVFGMTENPGGVESFIMNYYRRLDMSGFHFDFLCNSYDKIAYEDEILEKGSKTIHFAPRSKNPARFYKEINTFFKKHAKEYDAIWVNVSSLANISYLKLAKKYGIKRRIIHSHNSQNMDSRLRGKLHELNKRVITRYATDFWACSEEAAEWFYGKEIPKSRIEIIPNAIDVEKFKFSVKGRNEVRAELGWSDNLIIGNVGRLHFQKNQSFIIKAFAELHKVREDARLVLVGQGEDEDELRTLADSLGVKDQVFFAGLRDNITDWLSAFDVFFFPSLFEGLSIAALEAQANGLPMLVGEGCVSKDTKILDSYQTCDLNDDLSAWVDKLTEAVKIGRTPHEEVVNRFVAHNMEISGQIEKIENLFAGKKKAAIKRLSLKEIKETELNMLLAFDKFCRRNGLKYTLCGGTLLGAIRHKGFIPWDDDIDVGMPRYDYERLLRDKNLDYRDFPSYMQIGRWTDKTNNYPYMRVMDKRTRIKVPFYDPKTSVKNIWIDVFPFDGNPKDKNDLMPTIKRLVLLRKILAIKLAKLGEGTNAFKKYSKYVIRAILSPISIYRLCKYMDKISKKYPFDNADTISGVVWGLYGIGECIDRKGFVETTEVEFEGHKFMAMSNYDEYLTGLFKDYMQLPPEDKRVYHGFKAYLLPNDKEN